MLQLLLGSCTIYTQPKRSGYKLCVGFFLCWPKMISNSGASMKGDRHHYNLVVYYILSLLTTRLIEAGSTGRRDKK